MKVLTNKSKEQLCCKEFKISVVASNGTHVLLHSRFVIIIIIFVLLSLAFTVLSLKSSFKKINISLSILCLFLHWASLKKGKKNKKQELIWNRDYRFKFIFFLLLYALNFELHIKFLFTSWNYLNSIISQDLIFTLVIGYQEYFYENLDFYFILFYFLVLLHLIL